MKITNTYNQKNNFWQKKCPINIAFIIKVAFFSNQTVSSLKVECGFNLQGASLIAESVKNLPALQETPVQFLGWEDPLEK